MASSDRWIWLGVGVLTFVAVKSVSYALGDILRLTEIQDHKRTPGVSQETEDAINLESLYLLATCPNVDIRKAALKIFCDRFSQNNTAKMLLGDDLLHPDPETRTMAAQAAAVLEKYDVSHAIHQLPLPFLNPQNPSARTRTREENPEELALRRRRREAMVLNEGDHPVRQDDIIQRGGRARDDETAMTERALASLSEEPSASTLMNRRRGRLSEETVGI
ncbi:hypothetical protein P152DRAFT_472860 [Eremomyces bilateralis CBS 781.70]|uniref:Cytoskeleton-associated protein n=1 Tax=Eremomyces bilateralis CBS 781.70 TaxID=1392243 RepID=A0A6G1G7M3_9PEZI|nr:uncharacterized protein P152DRAFT_472860 [Eremomyces bilateralis CBS 781.70]KAF1814095.1 hypothetical protein P152DRAFT_472860 [Eremomyces bilateralis CBS 781.70]